MQKQAKESIKKEWLMYILRAASRFYEGDSPSGKNEIDEQTREEAREELSAMTMRTLNSAVLVEDNVTLALAGHLNKKLAGKIEHLTLGEVKKLLLGKYGAYFASTYGNGMSSELISALVKIMTNEELSLVSQKIFNSPSVFAAGEGPVKIGSRRHFGTRLQPNSAGDNPEEILFRILEGLSYGCGDVMIGLNPACDDVETVVQLANLLHDIVTRFKLPIKTCVLSDIAKLTLARRLGAKGGLGFQSLAGTEASLLGMVGIGIKEILELARGFEDGLYFEIGMGLEVSNGTDEGVDMRTLTSRAAGIARYIGQVTGKWMVVNTVTNFIGKWAYGTEEQLLRAGLEDILMLKLHGITGGIDVCASLDMRISPERLRAITETIVKMTRPAFIMSVPDNGFDPLLGYESIPPRAYPAILMSENLRMSSAMQNRLTELGVMECGVVKATPYVVTKLYAEYQKAGGDQRPLEALRVEGRKNILALQAQGIDIGYGCPIRFATPAIIRKRTDRIYDDAQRALMISVEPAVLRDISPKYLTVRTESTDRDDYIDHPKTGERLRPADCGEILGLYSERRPHVQLSFFEGLNGDALNENLRDIVPGVRYGLQSAGFHVGGTDVLVINGRTRVAYHIGTLLQVPIVIQFFGERPGTDKNMLSALITYGADTLGNSRWSQDMHHSFTTAVCGIHKYGKHPSTAVDEIVNLVKLMFEKKCSGVELYSRPSEKSLIVM